MTACAKWSALSIPPGDYTFSDDRLTAKCTTQPTAWGNAVCAPMATSGIRFFSITTANSGFSGQCQWGIADATTSLGQDPGPWPMESVVVDNAGRLWQSVGGVGTLICTFPSAYGTYDFYHDIGNHWIFVRQNGGDWNMNASADLASGLGAALATNINTLAIIFNANGLGGSATGFSAVLNTGATPYTYPAPSGANNLPATLDCSLVQDELANFVVQGAPAPLPWTDSSSTGLGYILDGGAVTACTGTVTGTGGTALGPSLSDGDPHSIALQSTANPLDQTGTYMLYGVAVSSGDTITLSHAAMIDGGGGGGPPRPSDQFTFTPVDNLDFFISGNPFISENDSFGIENFVSICTDTLGQTPILEIAFAAGNHSNTVTATFLGGVALVPPDSGPTSLEVTESDLDWKMTATGTIGGITISGADAFGTISLVTSAGTSTWNSLSFGGATETSVLQTFNTYAPIGAIRSGVAIIGAGSGPPPPPPSGSIQVWDGVYR